MAPDRLSGSFGSVARICLAGMTCAAVLPVWAYFRLSSWIAPNRRDLCFQGCTQLLSLWPGLIGSHLRRSFLVLAAERCSWNCSIGFGTIFASPEITIGEGVYIGALCNVAPVAIGRDTL